MAIIATLRAAENGHAGSGYSIASIPLNKLVLWDGNVRKTGASDNLEELTASIAALGVLQSLVVRKTSRGRFAIIAGRRRYLALSILAEGGTIAADAPVPCRVVPGSADATEISLTENVMRMPMHPADQFDAFRELIDNGSTPADIAARFGITEAGVKQRLKLARVSPVILEAYRNEDLNLDQVQAFAISDDHEAQEKCSASCPSVTTIRAASAAHLRRMRYRRPTNAPGLSPFPPTRKREARSGGICSPKATKEFSFWTLPCSTV